jgi:glutathione synthase/RimK-type ligase-like ATP-grasp enzyme
VRRPRIAAASCARVPQLDDDWLLLQAALAERGVEGTTAVWDDATVDWASFDLVVIRGTWDYFGRLEQFLAWARRVSATTRFLNPVSVVEWNTDKRYLRDLAAFDVPVVPTTWVAPGKEWSAPGGEFVIKPTVSAGAFETARYRSEEIDEARAHVIRLHQKGLVAMVQPYLPSVDDKGETALMYFGGRYSHAINKGALLRPGQGVVEKLWADMRITPATASAAQQAVADAALAAAAWVTEPATYARVDLLTDLDGGPVVIEVELVEPALFLQEAPGSAARLAEAISERL